MPATNTMQTFTALQPTKGTSLPLTQITRVEALDNYTRIHRANGRPMVVCTVLKKVAEQLQPYGFVRVHRSHLVNKQYVQSIQERAVTMSDASIVTISRRMRMGAMRQLSA